MNDPSALLLRGLLRALFGGVRPHPASYAALDVAGWERLFTLSTRQGVMALAFDALALLPDEVRPPRMLLIRWTLSREAVARRADAQRRAALDLCVALRNEGLCPVILKGLGLSRYYPSADARECGDIDLLVPNGADRVDDFARRHGKEVHGDFYKHSGFVWRGVPVENHRFCLEVRSRRTQRILERELHTVLAAQGSERIVVGDNELQVPPPDFDAVYLVGHMAGHYLGEGIALRHALDWGLFVAAERDRIDFAAARRTLARSGFLPLADAVSAVAGDILGPRAIPPGYCADAATEALVEADLYGFVDSTVKTFPDTLRMRLHQIVRVWRNRNRHALVGESVAGVLWHSLLGHLQSAPHRTADGE